MSPGLVRVLCSLVAALVDSFPLAAAVAAPEPPASVEEIVRGLQGKSGVCVLLGSGRGALPERLAAQSSLLVHVLDADADRVAGLRRALQARGLYGQVSVEHWTSAGLPYTDELVNVLIAENPGPVPDAEILRVLVPEGTAWTQRDGAWHTIHKPWPKAYDEWTHWRHGADGNMVSQDQAVALPAGVRWVAGPAQDAGGKRWYNDHVLVSAQGRNFYLLDDGLVARDAFNGSLLWTQRMKPSAIREIGTDVPSFLLTKARLGVRISKVKPVAVGDRVYLAANGGVLALDGATGRAVADYGRVTAPRELLVQSNLLVVSDTNVIRTFDISSGKVAWEAPMNTERMVAGDGRLFCFFGSRITGFDLASGRTLWGIADTNATPAATCTYHQGVLVLEKSSWRDDPGGCGVLAYSGSDGRLLWKREHKPSMTHFQETRAFFARGLLWLQTEGNKVVGLDPLTGKQRHSWKAGGQHCACPVATERFFIAPECDFTEWETGAQARTRLFKNACRLPFVPANGLLYSFPVQCECYPMLRGYMGLSAAALPAVPGSPRLERGPAFGRTAPARSPDDPASDWPMYRHDAYRSGSSPVVLRGTNLSLAWTTLVAQPPASSLAGEWNVNPFSKGRITPPVEAGGLVVVAVPDEHRIAALDATTGASRWNFTAGARIDTPPTIHEGLCLFGARDGWVYCLDPADGALTWKFRAAPQDTRIVAYGQLESLWPVPGSVLADQGIAYVAAGRHPHSDGGVRVFALTVHTGAVAWERTVSDMTLKHWYGWELPTRQKVGLDFEPVDLLVKDGDRVSMSRWRFNVADGTSQFAFDSITYQAPGLIVPRGLWSYGVRATKMVTDRAPAVFDQAGICTGTTNDVALALAHGLLLSAGANGDLKLGTQTVARDLRAVHDGLAVSRGRVFVSTQDGRVACLR